MAERTYELSTPLGSNVLMFYRMTVAEELSRLGECELVALSENGAIAIDKILGKEVSISAELPGGSKRYFRYFVTRFSQEGMHGRYHVYRASLRPWLWFLTQNANCRIFQEKSVPEIIKAVLEEQSFTNYKIELTDSYRKRVYCVQYRESDFNFISRLMEEEGIYYYFRHTEQNCTLVLADSKSAHAPFPNYKELRYIPAEGLIRAEEEHIFRWRISREVQPGKFSVRDYDFEKPSVDLMVNKTLQRQYEHSNYEVYDYPGEYSVKTDGEHYAGVRLEEFQAQYELADAESDARGICAGYLLNMTRHPRSDQNREYLIVSTQIEMRNNEWESADEAGIEYQCRFTAMSSQEAYRPKRQTRRPFVQGPQTAVVVGPAGDEIYTDKYGRVKVQFFWDRLGKKDQNSSCWMRVSHPWAGKNWGMIAIPRIGQEVIVDFIEGDPDQPIITGRVYNAEQMPPYALPANMTQTGIKTRSSKGGTGANFNEIRFEDKKGAEQLFIHAEKNQDIEVENDETHWVGHDRTKTIDHDETVHVKHDRTETVDNNETITIGVDRTEQVGSNESITIGVNRTESVGSNENITIGANRTESVGSNETITIGSNRSITVGANETATVAQQRTHTVGINETIAIGAAQEIAIGAAQSVTIGAAQNISVGVNRSVDVGSNLSTNVGADESRSVGGGRSSTIGKDDSLNVAKNLVINAGDSVTIKTGSASISMKKDGTIVIKGKDITIDGSGKINIKASSDVVMKGSKILQN